MIFEIFAFHQAIVDYPVLHPSHRKRKTGSPECVMHLKDGMNHKGYVVGVRHIAGPAAENLVK